MKPLFVLLVAIVGAVPVSAQCRSGTVFHQHVNAVAVVTPVVNAVLIPAYFAAYSPALEPEPQAAPMKMAEVPAPSPAPDTATVLAEILAALKRIEARLGATPTTPAPDPAPTDVTKTALGVIGASCNKCHNAATADAKGGGFTMVERDGTLSALGVKDKARITARVQKGQMPPPPAALTVADKAALVTFFGGKK